MNEIQKDIDIITELGGVNSEDKAMAVFRQYLDDTQLARISRLKHPEVLKKIANTVVLCNPERVFINTGSEADKEFIRLLALTKKEEASLAMEGHTIHFDLAGEQGRIIDRTFYIAGPSDDVSSLANRMDRPAALEEVRSNLKNIMQSKTMVVGFYIRGPKGSPVSNPALEITSSAYVSHSAELLYRNVYEDFENEIERQGAHGPETPDHLQFQMHLCRQHPAPEKRES